MAKSARERSTCAAGALSERLRRVSSWRSSAVSGRRGSFRWRDMGHLGARGSPHHHTRSHGKRPTRMSGGRPMSPSESDPSPRTVATRGPAETATPATTASQGTIARPLNDGRSEGPGNSERTPVAADTQMSSPAPPGPAVTSRPDRVWIPDPSLHHIVIVGGGAAGLELATKLGDSLGQRRKAQITLVERARTHIWKPHLHEVAAGTMDVGRDAVDYLAQASDHHF